MLFVVDFDGTLSLRDSVDALLERFAPASWHAIEADWVEGRITARECMRRQMALLEANELDLDRFFQQIRLDAAFPRFVEMVSSFARVAVVSDGLGQAVGAALKRFKVSDIPFFANHLVFEAGRWSLEFPNASEACAVGSGVCKCAVAESLRLNTPEPMILIGDGRSDQCVARRADYVFAKDSLARYCMQEGIAFTEFSSFEGIIETIARWKENNFVSTDGLALSLIK